MRSFRLQRERFPAGVLAVPIAAACAYWHWHLRQMDLGANDFSGGFYLVGFLLLFVLAVGLALAGVAQGIADWMRRGSRLKVSANLLGGIAALILVAVGAIA